jgi:hypothetical protein
MNAKEIHDHLISLFFRCIGGWLLYLAVNNFITVAGDFIYWVFPHPNQNPGERWDDVRDVLFLVAKLLAAAYFLLGAPPFLRWACRKPVKD